jgi:cytochrome c biogenesis protein CcdA/thiol-disulfide isomerase/thioredoxin
MIFFIVAFAAGLLTVLAPCILPVLPVIIGSSSTARSKITPYVIVGSLAVSIILFTYVLKVSSAFIMIPPYVWTYLSGGILAFFGLTLIFPGLWEKLPGIAKFSAASNKLVGSGYQKRSLWGDIIMGAALGPVFSTCSPTYFVILASVLPVSFLEGTVYILAYVLGLSLVLLGIALLGNTLARKLSGFSASGGWFKRSIGIVFLLLGIAIATGYESKLEVFLLSNGFDITKIEQRLLKQIPQESIMPENTKTNPYKEIVDPSGFVNTDGITIEELIGKKVILVDFMTYSCINCQRTFPYLVAWYERYKDRGLEIVGIHTPEFAFEKDIHNVRNAMREFGITYPVVLDNDYATWRNYGNRYWPRKYLIDIFGNIVYDHIGEGNYKETETKIQELLQQRAIVLGQGGPSDMNGELEISTIPQTKNFAQSPETYFGASRNEYFANGIPNKIGEQNLTAPNELLPNLLYLDGTWSITAEHAESIANARILYTYSAKEVYLVAEAEAPAAVEIFQDGNIVNTIIIQESRLYKIIQDQNPGEHVLELRIQGQGVRFFAFTFG